MEQRAFEHIASRLRQKALDTSLSHGADITEAEDIAQDTMLRLWQMRDQLHRYRSPEALAAVIAKHLTLNHLRRRHTLPIGHDGMQIAATGSNPADHLEDSENEEWLQQRLSQLPTTQYTILYMRQVERRSAQEIAGLLGIAETSVRTLLARARKSLLEQFKQRR